MWGSPSKNIQQANDAIKALPKSDLYVLPEMFSTGFVSEPNGMAESENGESLAWMKLLAHELDAAIAGSVAVSTANGYRNRFYFVKPDGGVTEYDKHHLFTFSGEHRLFTRGSDRKIVEWRGVRFLLNVCYDLRFPVWSRNRKDYDAAIYVARWARVRQIPWETLLRARAIENQCFVLGVNRVGNDPSLEYAGGTALIDPYGATVVGAEDGKEEVVVADLDLQLLEDFRVKIPGLEGADEFEIKK